jgi:hypothetical protein
MSWRDLLKKDAERSTLPWTGGRSLHSESRTLKLAAQPREHGWYTFKIDGNTALDPVPADPVLDLIKKPVTGYLVGDRIVIDDTRIDPDPAKIAEQTEKVYLVDDALDRFARIRAGRIYSEGPLIFLEQTFPLGPEDSVMNAFLDNMPSVREISGVTPGLDAAFRMEVYRREQAEARRIELARLAAEEEARRAAEQLRREINQRYGSSERLRELARIDFGAAAKTALAVGGAEYLDHRQHGRGGTDYAVKYRIDGHRLECVCDVQMRIIDAGVCLTDHRTETKYDQHFTLESLPSVIREAINKHKLVVWRHA